MEENKNKEVNNEEAKENIKEEALKAKEDKIKDTRSLGEKIEDGIDSVQDIFYGDDYLNDIPATIRNANGRKVVNKVQTRRNLNKRIFSKGGWKIVLFSFIIILLLGFIMEKLGLW